MQYVIGFIVVVVGALMVIKTGWFVSFTGGIGWAEEHLSTFGGTQMMIKMIGIVAIFGAFLSMTGLLQAMFSGAFGALINGGR